MTIIINYVHRFGVNEDPVLLGGIDLKNPIVRIGGLIFILLLQVWLLVTFLNYQRGRFVETISAPPPIKKSRSKNKKTD